MPALKVWDGTAWQTVSQGPPGAYPVTSVDGRTGAVTLTDLYLRTDNTNVNTGGWTPYTPVFASENNPSGAGMTPGVGGGCSGWYRMVAPYTMAVWMRFQWGSSGANGGNAELIWSIPPGYTCNAATHQYGQCIVWTGDNFVYAGYTAFYANDVWMRCHCPWSGITDKWTGNQVRIKTGSGNPPMHPPLWYPSGGVEVNAVFATNQQW